MKETNFEDKCLILSDLWMDYRYDEEFKDFVEYNDLGLPLAYTISNNIVNNTPTAQAFIEEAFELFLAGLGIDDDGFTSLDEILDL
jgi:hypothetical protein